jgi:Ca2+-transporting ATPase
LITLAVLSAFGLAFSWLGAQSEGAVTISFLTLAFAQLWHVFNMRAQGSSFLRNEITRNQYIWGALVLCAGLLVAAVYIPILSDVLKVTNPGSAGWALALTMSLMPWGVGQVLKTVR